MIKIILADDHDLVRTGIRRILEDVNDFTIIAEAKNGEDAVQWCRKNAPDVVLMDVNMPGIGGLEATKRIVRMSENTRVICVSMHKESPIPMQVMDAGAFGFLTKDAEPDEVILAIRKVAAGQKYIDSEVANSIAIGKLLPSSDNPFDELSSRELTIAMRLTEGHKVPDIARELCINSKTVNTYRYRMFQKLGVSSDVELTHLAYRHKLINPNTF
ncbi:UvrY/SirA/GacA family response regulator transcription factor [Alteromonas marina]|uniref:Two-component system response regulator UvrY n=1 Tax=Alteromonas gracilis TaxID=1479524 RepID=A0ABX5CNL0_9ALTE|nr:MULTISPECIES: UvrY/SirA/GacA family response regulator transcription factor [Alteromonas]APD86387.1 two-component system response regulator UvrY [Alteromonas sp. Mex14]PRO69159.1 two-component system response regulator UvrY [Alteromonas gracilis]GFD70659.1 DNA-binding response regulator [Tenacibaculum sp. KUL113]GFD85965.1 DNA-binding response regulator [Alteromonas sp. KUL150]